MTASGYSPQIIDAGPFGPWLEAFLASLRGNSGTDVPCGDCVGCCMSSYTNLVRPEEIRARKAIGEEWLTSVPSLGVGMQAMGHLAEGTCPMLHDRQCSVYNDRPLTCRDFDCRVFAAAGIDSGRSAIDARVRVWRFSYASESDRAAHRAIAAAAAFIGEHSERFPELRLPKNPTGIAVLATKCHALFLEPAWRERNPLALATAITDAARAFDSGTS
jgi:Fe-S-cluster containining protein